MSHDRSAPHFEGVALLNARHADRPTAETSARVVLGALLCLLLAPVAAQAGRVSLAWDPSPDAFVVGYIVYYGTVPGTYSASIDVGNTTTHTLQGLTNGVTFYFVVHAYSFDLIVSDPSNEVSGVPANLPPSVMNPGDITMKSTSLVLSITATDPDFDQLTYAATGLPTELAINSSTGVISGTVPVGTHTITVTVSDGAAEASTTFTITGTPNTAPTLTNPGDRTDAEGAGVSLQLIGSDADGDELRYSASGLPPGLTLTASTGLIAGTLPYTAAGVYATTFTVVDGDNKAQVSIAWTVTNVNRAPIVTNPGAQTTVQGVAVALSMTATDADGDPLAWSAAVNLPPGLSINASTGVISGTPTTLGTYAVAITVSDGSATGQADFTWTVAVPPPGPATPISPSDGIATATPDFTWAAVPNVGYYLLSISDADPASPTRVWYTPTQAGCGSGTGSCTVAAPRALTSGLVSWKVLTWNTSGYGPWSGTMQAAVDGVDALLAVPAPIAPSGPVGTRTPTYQWNPVSGVTWYELSATDALGTTSVFWYSPEQACASSPCAATPNTLLAIGPAQWQIRAWSGAGAGQWSSTVSFETASSAPGKATVIGPAGAITSLTPTFTWNGVLGTSYYLLRVTDRDNVTSDRWYRPSQVGCPLGTEVCTVSPGIAVDPGPGNWQVLTWNAAGYGPWSDTRAFSVEIADSLAGVPAVVSPTDAVGTAHPTYTWTAVAGAVNYRLSIRVNESSAMHSWYRPLDAGCDTATQCSIVSQVPLQNGTAEWQVQVWTANGHGDWSPLVPLGVSVPAPPAPALVSPDGSTSTSPSFTWNASAGASYYYVRVSDSGGLRVSRWVTPEQLGCLGGGVCTFGAGITLSSGEGAWQVIAWNSSGYSPWSSTIGFTVP